MNKCIKKAIGFAAFTVGTMAVINKAIDIICTKNYSSSETEHIYEWKYGRISYVKKGHGAPLLLVHRTNPGANRKEWDKVFTPLAEKYTVYSINLLGWGNSDKPKLTYNAYTNAMLINDFINDVIGKKTAVCASAGSASALLMAYTTIPKNFSRLVFTAPEMYGKKAVCAHEIKRAIISLPVIGTFIYNILTVPCAIKAALKLRYFDPYKAERENIKALYIAEHMNGGGKYAYACSLSGFTSVDVRHLLRDVNVPITVITGEEAELDGTIDELEAIRPDAHFFIFENTGEYPHRENPVEFVNVLKSI
ncbi:MAG: alpha/beta fold hydrolase [Lachnospiraceae bacterium]|nr:alpha/beta fold hydrolase [Lachnospiraceae bacterium]